MTPYGKVVETVFHVWISVDDEDDSFQISECIGTSEYNNYSSQCKCSVIGYIMRAGGAAVEGTLSLTQSPSEIVSTGT